MNFRGIAALANLEKDFILLFSSATNIEYGFSKELKVHGRA